MIESLQTRIEAAFASGRPAEAEEEVHETIRQLDCGMLRVAEPGAEGWVVHAWVKQAILLYFRLRKMETIEVGPYEYRDKIPLKQNLEQAGVRLVPPGTIRYGAFVEPGAVIMPGYVNIGARVGAGSMVDTWATVGSCAQIGKHVHLSGGVGIGGVLEPVGSRPVIIEDGCFIGSRCIVVEGVHVQARAVLGAGVVLSASTPIIDVTGPEPVTYKGRVPAGSVVVPGTRKKQFPAGEFDLPCALIIGQRKASTDEKTSLNDMLREVGIAT